MSVMKVLLLLSCLMALAFDVFPCPSTELADLHENEVLHNDHEGVCSVYIYVCASVTNLSLFGVQTHRGVLLQHGACQPQRQILLQRFLLLATCLVGACTYVGVFG